MKVTVLCHSNNVGNIVVLVTGEALSESHFQAEDFSLEMTPIRRREALERHILTFRKDVEREQRGKEGID